MAEDHHEGWLSSSRTNGSCSCRIKSIPMMDLSEGERLRKDLVKRRYCLRACSYSARSINYQSTPDDVCLMSNDEENGLTGEKQCSPGPKSANSIIYPKITTTDQIDF